MRVLNVSSGDLVGSRFNGYDWHDHFLKLGIETNMLVHWNNSSSFEWVDQLQKFKAGDPMENAIRKRYQLNQFLGDEDRSLPWSRRIFDHHFYKSADVVHLQVVHDGTLDIGTMERIMKEKPTVWTWHDPWPMTGHCIYPMGCNRWNLGCGECPDLLRPIRIGRDKTKENRARKATLIGGKYALHVSTQWFADLIEGQHLTGLPKPLVIPFGIDSKQFNSSDRRSARESFNLSEDDFVIGVRATSEKQKNYNSFLDAMDIIPRIKNLRVVTLQEVGTLAKHSEKLKPVDIGWTNDNETLSQFFAAIDLFVMPSRYETFGFMAIESMSTGTPVLAIEGTAIDEICKLKENGYALESGSPKEIVRAILEIYSNREDLMIRGLRSRAHVEEKFDIVEFTSRLAQLYRFTVENFTRYD